MATREPIRILGIDTSLRSTGVGVVEATGSRLAAVEYGILKNAPRHPVSKCLKHIQEGISDIIDRATPTAVAIEGAFYCKNARTALVLEQRPAGDVLSVGGDVGLGHQLVWLSHPSSVRYVPPSRSEARASAKAETKRWSAGKR